MDRREGNRIGGREGNRVIGMEEIKEGRETE